MKTIPTSTKRRKVAKTAAIMMAAASMASSAAYARIDDGPWLFRARAANIQSANSDATGLGLKINDKLIAEVDVTYFFSKSLAAELLLTVPQKHHLSAGGANIGSVSHLAPTLLFQYHFNAPGFRPYAGLGLNYTKFTSVNLPVGVTMDRHSIGGAIQLGADIPLTANTLLNLDIKKIRMGTDVMLDGAKAGTFKIDPLVLAVGFGWRF